MLQVGMSTTDSAPLATDIFTSTPFPPMSGILRESPVVLGYQQLLLDEKLHMLLSRGFRLLTGAFGIRAYAE